VGDAVLELVSPSQESASSGSAGRADMKICESERLGSESIEIWCFEDGVSVCGDVAVSLVICEEEKDIGPFSCERSSP
jgi:hypothetical protein